ncbi:MAG: hypothetical protein EOM02_02575 [Synergistales bacterium]|nr:hypothetical protein [Synergistales bacterium]
MMLRTLRTQVKWILVFFLACFVLAIPLMYGVGGNGDSRGHNEDYAVAEVDGKKVMFSQMIQSVQQYVDNAGIKDITSSDMPMLYQMVLDQMVIGEALDKEVKAMGIKPSKEDLDKAVAEISDQFPTKEAFQQYLSESGVSLEKLRKQLEVQLSEQMLLSEASASAAVAEDELQELYDSVKDFVFTSPEGYEVLAAEFSSKEDADKAYEALVSGDGWNEVMSSFTSEDLKGHTEEGKFAFIKKDSLSENLAFIVSMDDKTYYEPVEMASDDFLVIYREGFKDKELTSFEEAKAQLSSMVLNQKQQDLQRAFLDEISSKVKVKILDPSLFPEKKEVKEEVLVEEVSLSEDKTSPDAE